MAENQAWKRPGGPGIPDLVALTVLVSVLVGGRNALLNDPGTSWHLRLGREILQAGQVPRTDFLTYTRVGTPWVDQSWAFDVGLALVVDHWGWSAAIALSAIGLATLYGGLARSLIKEESAPLVAALVALLASGISSLHFLIRPHLFTLWFFYLTSRICKRQHNQGGWVVLTVPLLMVPWANLHGGFLAGPVIVLTAALGHLVSRPWNRATRVELGKYLIALVLCVLAPLINPYGMGLYQHVLNLLGTSGVTSLIQEYQPIAFGQPEFLTVELTLLALIALPTVSARRIHRYDLVQLVVWLHFALGSVRHIPLFAIAMAPALATLADGLPITFRTTGVDRSRWSFWFPVVSGLVMSLACFGVSFGGFSAEKWPLEAVAVLNQQSLDSPLFHEQDWGGIIEERTRPPRKAFIDDRFELFGRQGILEYIDAIQGGPAWDDLLERERFKLVWVKPDRGLAKRLAIDSRWKTLHRDNTSVLYQRTDPTDPSDSATNARLDASESTMSMVSPGARAPGPTTREIAGRAWESDQERSARQISIGINHHPSFPKSSLRSWRPGEHGTRIGAILPTRAGVGPGLVLALVHRPGHESRQGPTAQHRVHPGG